jgi:hypothetical protein
MWKKALSIELFRQWSFVAEPPSDGLSKGRESVAAGGDSSEYDLRCIGTYGVKGDEDTSIDDCE